MFRLGKCAVVYLQVIMREGEGACSDDRRTFTTYPGRLRACQSSPHPTRPGVMFFFCLSSHLMITLCSDQRATSKSEQETRAKGAPLSFYLSVVPRFPTPLQTASAS